MANDAYFAVAGYVATQPTVGKTKGGAISLSMRVAWTPRAFSKATGEWTDQQTSFVSVTCYRKVAENAAKCLRRGDPITLRGSIQVREYTDQAGVRRKSIDVVADSLGHDMSRGVSHFNKTLQRAQQTAEEYQWSTAAERAPLPGDVAAGLASEQRSDMPHPSGRAEPPEVESAAGDPDELTPGWNGPELLADAADDADDVADPADLDDEADPGRAATERSAAELAGARD